MDKAKANRTIHGITWHDDLAWMEDMKGSRWDSHIQKEQTRWKKAIEPLEDTIRILEDELDSASKPLHTMLFRAGNSQIEIGVEGGMTISWKYKGEPLTRSATTLETTSDGSRVWTIEEVGNGAELYAISMYLQGNASEEAKAKWSWQHVGVAPFLAIVGDRCYCLEAKKSLVYWRLVSWDSMTGKDRKIHYEEEDFRYNLELIGGNRGYAYLKRQSGTKQDAFLITSEHEVKVLEGISLEPRRFVFGPGPGPAGYLVWEDGKGWMGVGVAYILPSFVKEVPETLDLRREFLVTKWEGCRTLWKISKTKNPVVIWKGYGNLLLDPWESSWIRFVFTGEQEVCWWDSQNSANVSRGPKGSKGSKGPRGPRGPRIQKAKSLDGTLVPFLVVNSSQKPQRLFVIGYGAYGLPTPLMTQRWEPLLTRGWTIVIGLWRGGGDHTPEWEDAARPLPLPLPLPLQKQKQGRMKVLEDAEAVVRAAQEMTGIPAKNTVLYGRSAGGLWVAALAVKAALAGGIYMEVPYLDVLRTITNRNLPLTEIESEEFGLPEEHISDFISALEWSPMELLVSSEGLPGTWQIVRTGMNDSEVLAYESVKWIERSKNPKAFLAIEGGQGHFVSGSRGFRQQAEDLAMILSLSL